jgi:hypothetical protein
MIGERTTEILRDRRARETQAKLPVIASWDKRIRIDAAGEWFGGGAMTHVNATTSIRAEENAGTIRLMVQAVRTL